MKFFRIQRRRHRRVVMVVETPSRRIVPAKLTNKLRDNARQVRVVVQDRTMLTFRRRPQSKGNPARSNLISTCGVMSVEKSHCRKVVARAEGKRHWSNDAAGTHARSRSEVRVHVSRLTRRCARLSVSKDVWRP